MVLEDVLHDLVDSHIHLGSASSPHFLWELAHDQGIHLPEKDYWKFIKSVTIPQKKPYAEYLKLFDLTELIQSSPYAVEKSVHHAISSAYRLASVTTAEIRFNPMFRNNGGEQDLDKIILSATIGMKKALIEYPVRAGLIMIMDRRLSVKLNSIIVEKAIHFKNEGVVGIDIAGPLAQPLDVKGLLPAVEMAKAAGLKVTVHTGEVTSPDEMWEVVTVLKPHRIGHGIQAVHDEKLMEHLAHEKIVLEMCPSSNLRTQAAKDWDEIKDILHTLKKHNVLFTINSDNPEFLETNVKQEYLELYNRDILSATEIEEIINLSRKVTFVNQSEKTLYE